jgi:hypothetical protein
VLVSPWCRLRRSRIPGPVGVVAAWSTPHRVTALAPPPHPWS